MKKNLATLCWKCIICVIAISGIHRNLTYAQASAETSTLLPTPENLKPNVEFWKKVYTFYNSDQIIIHDTDDLRIIYEVIDLDNSGSNDQYTVRVPWGDVEKIKNKYKNILIELGSSEQVNPELLSPEHRTVYNLFQSKATPAVFKQAAQNIRAQQGLRDEFRRGLIRSGRYAEHITNVLEKHNVPSELIALPHVESSYNYRAYSKFGAAGIWQFTRGTGRRFLHINYMVDERFDPIKSSEAAARLLRENYEELGTWPLAINAYNHGTNGLKRAVSQLGTTDIGVIIEKYEGRSYKFASRNFYAEFLAALEARTNYRDYFGDLEFDQAEKFTTFVIPNNVKLSLLAEQLKVTSDDIERLNPCLRSTVLSSKRPMPKGLELKIPWRADFDVASVSVNIPATEQYQQQIATDWYQIESGDNLQSIARRFNTTVADLMELNDIRNPHQVYVGQVIRLRPEDIVVIETRETTMPVPKIEEQPKAEIKKEPEVSSPDRFAMTPIQPKVSPPKAETAKKELPKVEAAKEFAVADRTEIDVVERQPLKPSKPSFGKIIVQPEETLGHYADWLGLPTQVLRNLNSLIYGQDIQLGQEIKLVFDNVSEKEFQRRRMEYHRGIEEDFFASYVIDGVVVHKIKSGENIWYLCNQVYEIPYWLLQKYNPNKNLERLTAGDELIIPVVGQTGNNRSIG